MTEEVIETEELEVEAHMNHFDIVSSFCDPAMIEHVDYEDYYAITHGFIFGLVEDPEYDADDCILCKNLGNSVGALQEGMVGAMAAEPIWGNT